MNRELVVPASRHAMAEKSSLSGSAGQGHGWVGQVHSNGGSMNREEVFRSLNQGSFNDDISN